MFTPIQRYKFFSLQIYPPLQFSKFSDGKVKFISRFIVYYITNTLQIYWHNSTIPNFEQTFFEKFLIPIFNRGGAVRSETAEAAETAGTAGTAEKVEKVEKVERVETTGIFSLLSLSVLLSQSSEVGQLSPSKKYEIFNE